jgi:hypothetical protein
MLASFSYFPVQTGILRWLQTGAAAGAQRKLSAIGKTKRNNFCVIGSDCCSASQEFREDVVAGAAGASIAISAQLSSGGHSLTASYF